MKKNFLIITCIICFMSNGAILSQSNNILNDQIKVEAIKNLSLMLKDYLNPDLGLEVSNMLTKNLNDGKYREVNDFNRFAKLVSDDMFKLTKDKHLVIWYDRNGVEDIKKSENLTGKEKEAFFNYQKEISSKRNYGFKEVKILPGNIGYIKFNEFERAEIASKTAHSAIDFISNTDAIIIDLRNNNGGWGSMVQLILSYFTEFQDEKNNILLFEKKLPYLNETRQYRTLPDLPGKRIIQTPLYILTSKNTYSAAEAFTDVLQKRNRAIVVGEYTRGGAHSTRGPEILTDDFIVKMPVAEVFNSQTKKNWEGTGVEPDIKVDSKQSFDSALMKIFNEKNNRNSNENYFNNLGYSFLNENMLNIAILLFNENVKKYPKSSNAFDSLGEAYMLNGQNKLAIKNYKKSLELDPENTNAKEILDKLLKN